MKLGLVTLSILVMFLTLSPSVFAQAASNAETLKDHLAGQKFLVTYRQGGPVYGTYFFLSVHLCRSGNYMTLGQSRKQSVLDSHGEHVHTWRDQGRWDVKAFAGQLGVQYISSSGEMSFYPLSIRPNGQISTVNGMTVVRQGSAQCP